jgi:cell division septum initiation protein DivIVA
MNGSANNMIMFRTSRKGYDKGDVHRYIEEMNIRFAATEEKTKQQIRRLEMALEEAQAQTPVVDEAALQTLRQENEALKAELAALREQVAAVKEAPVAEDKPAVEVPLTYDEASKRLGDILLKANLDADRIVAEAEVEANRQLTGAEKQADDIRLDAAVTARLMTDRVKRRLTALTGEYIDSMESVSRASAEEYRKLFDELKGRLDAARVDAAVALREAKQG